MQLVDLSEINCCLQLQRSIHQMYTHNFAWLTSLKIWEYHIILLLKQTTY
jgi:hypothetical protein